MLKTTNVILHGPPGTGKTYRSIMEAVRIVRGAQWIVNRERSEVVSEYRKLQNAGQIEFVTFHQSYGYEEFVEGLRPVLDDLDEGEVRYEIHAGTLKRIATRATSVGLAEPEEEDQSFGRIWSSFLDQVEEAGEIRLMSRNGKSLALKPTAKGNLLVWKVDENGELIETQMCVLKRYMEVFWNGRNEIGPDPEQMTASSMTQYLGKQLENQGGHHNVSTWPVYKYLWENRQNLGTHDEGIAGGDFDIPERVRNALRTSGRQFDFSNGSDQFVLIIDEINRGNMSKILGELITLLEPDKRLGMSEELRLPLTYSPNERFALPPNLHIIGTMNTADRSIALMDVALRRRFQFEEVMPDALVVRDLISARSGNKTLGEFLGRILDDMNARIRFIHDREHQIGHSYFLSVTDLEDLRRLFVDRVIPLLQEYFFDAWGKVCLVLGCPYDENGRPSRTGAVLTEDNKYLAPMVSADALNGSVVSGWSANEYDLRFDYSIHPDLRSTFSSASVAADFFLGIPNLSGEERTSYRTMLSALEA